MTHACFTHHSVNQCIYWNSVNTTSLHSLPLVYTSELAQAAALLTSFKLVKNSRNPHCSVHQYSRILTATQSPHVWIEAAQTVLNI